MNKFNHFLVWFTICFCLITILEHENVSVPWVLLWGILFEITDRKLLRPLMLKEYFIVIKMPLKKGKK